MFKFLSLLEQFSIFPMQAIIIGPFDLSITNQVGILILLFVVLLVIFISLIRNCKIENNIFIYLFCKYNIIFIKNYYKKYISFPLKNLLLLLKDLYRKEFLSILLFIYFELIIFIDIFFIIKYLYELKKIKKIFNYKFKNNNLYLWYATDFIINSKYCRDKVKAQLLYSNLNYVEYSNLVYRELIYQKSIFLYKLSRSFYIVKIIFVLLLKLLLFLLLIILFM